MTRSGPADPSHGLVVGGLGGPEDQLIEDGQEEVFSRAEVERGRIEHKTQAGGDADQSTGVRSARSAPSTADRR